MDNRLPTFNIQVDAYQAGVLLGMIERAEGHLRTALSSTRAQLVAKKREWEEADGIVKNLLPDGRMEIIYADGYRSVRPPYSWEVENN